MKYPKTRTAAETMLRAMHRKGALSWEEIRGYGRHFGTESQVQADYQLIRKNGRYVLPAYLIKFFGDKDATPVAKPINAACSRDPDVYKFKPLDINKYFRSMQPKRAEAGELNLVGVKTGSQGYIKDIGK